MNDLKSKSNIKLMKRVLTTYELRKYLKKYFCLTLDNYLVLAYLDVFKNDEGKYFIVNVNIKMYINDCIRMYKIVC